MRYLEGARPEVVRDILGHAKIAVTQNLFGKSWREERVNVVTQAVDGNQCRSKCRERREKNQITQTISFMILRAEHSAAALKERFDL
jgi:hypothetical protein